MGEIIVYSSLLVLFILLILACKLVEKVSNDKWKNKL
jgi:hypothetical protein